MTSPNTQQGFNNFQPLIFYSTPLQAHQSQKIDVSLKWNHETSLQYEKSGENTIYDIEIQQID